MRIPQEKLRNVVFLVEDGTPRATGFFVLISEPIPEGGIRYPYIVTARHCVEATAGRPFAIRLNVEDRYDEIPTAMDDWWIHDSEDVALIRFSEGPSSPKYVIQCESVETFIAEDYTFNAEGALSGLGAMPGLTFGLSGRWKPDGEFEPMERAPVTVGDEVFFVSLLYEQPGERRNLPIARFGHISRMPEEPILMERTGGGIVPLTAYLAESHSWGGHSGSPVYWTHPFTLLRELPEPGEDGKTFYLPQIEYVTALLGLVSGHWDIEQPATTEGDIVGSIRTAINSGIAVVTPAQAIVDLLMRKDVVEDRKQAAAKRRKELIKRKVITPDTAPGNTEFERFEDLTQKLVNTPKPKATEDE